MLIQANGVSSGMMITLTSPTNGSLHTILLAGFSVDIFALVASGNFYVFVTIGYCISVRLIVEKRAILLLWGSVLFILCGMPPCGFSHKEAVWVTGSKVALFWGDRLNHDDEAINADHYKY